jgi:hypothetical protein
LTFAYLKNTISRLSLHTDFKNILLTIRGNRVLTTRNGVKFLGLD